MEYGHCINVIGTVIIMIINIVRNDSTHVKVVSLCYRSMDCSRAPPIRTKYLFKIKIKKVIGFGTWKKPEIFRVLLEIYIGIGGGIGGRNSEHAL